MIHHTEGKQGDPWETNVISGCLHNVAAVRDCTGPVFVPLRSSPLIRRAGIIS